MFRKLTLILLLLVVAGALGGAFYVLKHRRSSSTHLDHLHMAEALMESKDYDNAIQNLLPVVQAGKRFERADYALYLLAQVYDAAGHKEAGDIWKRLADDFPQSEYALDARLRQAQSFLDSTPLKSREIYEDLSKTGPGLVHDKAILGIAQSYDKEKNVDKARELYYGIIASVTELSVLELTKNRLSEINTERLWSPVLDDFCQLYTVGKGDVPIKIGPKFGTTAWFVEEANGVKAGGLKPGRRLKVPKEPYHIIVSKELCRLELRTASGRFVKWYPCGVGEQSYKTPAGNYYIIDKQINPVWYPPAGGRFAAGDPENALGSRWMSIGGSLGIHGTNAPDTIGKPKSAGCIRMHNKDVEELYKLVTLNTNVTIVDGSEMNVSYVPKNATAGITER